MTNVDVNIIGPHPLKKNNNKHIQCVKDCDREKTDKHSVYNLYNPIWQFKVHLCKGYDSPYNFAADKWTRNDITYGFPGLLNTAACFKVRSAAF